MKDALNSLKEAQSQLIQSKTMSSLGTLTAGVAHELITRLMQSIQAVLRSKKILQKVKQLGLLYEQITKENIESQLELIQNYKEEINLPEILEGIINLLNNIERGSKRTIDIVQSLKTFTHKDLTQKEYINIHDNIDSTLTLLNHKIRDRITVNKVYGDVSDIMCFPGKINQVFMNLFSNAIDAIEDKDNSTGENIITITTSQVEKSGAAYLEITISDTGKGIPDEIKNEIFEPFFTTKEVGKGSGLGLSISHGIIESHSGSISMESKIGVGTSFIILLPYNQEINKRTI